ncbi:hypothetical protein, partial [Streptomyces dysideae]|uniref:hypothetical protein n=1 Tax=Streptomyces dysideae TaxID=909626 RepID=UPI000AD0582B
ADAIQDKLLEDGPGASQTDTAIPRPPAALSHPPLSLFSRWRFTLLRQSHKSPRNGIRSRSPRVVSRVVV